MRAGGADVAAVEDETVVDVFPIFLWDECLEIVRDFFEIIVVGEIKALGETFYVRVGGNTFPLVKKFAENDMRCLVANAGERLQTLGIVRDLAAKIVTDDFGGSDNVLCLIAKKRNRGDFFLKNARLGPSEVESSLVFLENLLVDPIHHLVGALCRHDDCKDKLERGFVFQFAFWSRVGMLQIGDDFANTQMPFVLFFCPHGAILAYRVVPRSPVCYKGGRKEARLMSNNDQSRPAQAAGGLYRKAPRGAGSEPGEVEPGKVAPVVTLSPLDKRPADGKS